eukprot:TRINITY_DN7337_c0_g1_i1.p1 TRINITY_DN7337_c0_g1~~TRINITY_DN7337_c0_g1_i1.p1  ORF type:complete len:639 (+),score=162.20 TRINITY_DN7337_c0_g1_i1:1685-3601(+)
MNQHTIGDYVYVEPRIGTGSFAEVYKGLHRVTGQVVAIKIVDLDRLSRNNSKLKRHLEFEIRIMQGLDHPNIVRLYDVIQPSERHIVLVLEYCAGGDFSRYIRRHRRLTESRAQTFMSQLADGLKFLRQKDIIHRDLKPQNLLLSDHANPTLKIADFGFARFIEAQSLADTLCGSPLYMAPEILKLQNYTIKADLWSVGIILFEMLSGTSPFDCKTPYELLQMIEKKPIHFPDSIPVSAECLDLIYGLLQKDPTMRISWDAFFKHVWFVGHQATAPQPSQSHPQQSPSHTPSLAPPSVPFPFDTNTYGDAMQGVTQPPFENAFFSSSPAHPAPQFHAEPPAFATNIQHPPHNDSFDPSQHTMTNMSSSPNTYPSNPISSVPKRMSGIVAGSGSGGSGSGGSSIATPGSSTLGGSAQAEPAEMFEFSDSFDKDFLVVDPGAPAMTHPAHPPRKQDPFLATVQNVEVLAQRALALAELGDIKVEADLPNEALPAYLRALGLIHHTLTVAHEAMSAPGAHSTFTHTGEQAAVIMAKLVATLQERFSEYIRKVEHWKQVLPPQAPVPQLEQMIYTHALYMGRVAGVDEMWERFQRCEQVYASGLTLLEYLFSVANEQEDKKALGTYITAFRKRLHAVRRRRL